MSTYTFELHTFITVEADSEEEAEEKVRDEFDRENSEFTAVLDEVDEEVLEID
jgi:hypothetical protein